MIPSLNRCDIAQPDLRPVALGDQNVAEVLRGVDQGIRMYAKILFTGFDSAGIHNDTFGDQLGADVVDRDADLGESLPVEFDIHRLVDRAEERDFGDILDQHELFAKELCDIVKLSIAVLIAIQGEENAVHVGIVVVHERGSSPRWQLRS